jgi:arylsulfatase A-like enzyme
MYSPAKIFLPPGAEHDNKLFVDQRKTNGEEKIRNILAKYLGLVSQVDYGIGIILQELKTFGQLENTIIVYSADHGDFAGEHSGFEKCGGISTRAITCIPMIFRYPEKAAQDIVCDEIVESVDVFPTLCELAGIEIPDTVQGKSICQLLNGSNSVIHDSALTENPYRKALATKEWRYVANLSDEKDELYDLKNDQWEHNNLIDDPAYKDIADCMFRKLFRRIAEARRPIHTLNGFWHNQKYDRNGLIDINKCGEITPYW